MAEKAGFFVKDITPREPVFLAGYPSRNALSDGVEDPLHLRIMALEDEQGRRAAVVTADLLKFPKDMAWRTKRWAEEHLGLPSASLIINLSHTHSAPALFYQECYPHWALNVGYVRDLEADIRDGLEQALRGLQPVRIRYGLHRAHFGVNRRRPDPDRPGKVKMGPNPAAYYDPDMPILAFHRPEDDSLIALFYTYGCHPTSKAGNHVSADYPGQMSRALKSRLGADTITLFAQGAGADIMPRYSHRTAEDRAVYGQRWASVANEMADFVQSGRMQALSLSIAGREAEFVIPYDMTKFHSEEEIFAWADPHEPPVDRFVRPANRQIMRLWANGILEKLRTGSLPEGFTMHATRLSLSADLQIIGLSGEVTAEVGRLVKDNESAKETIFLGYCSYTDAYIPTAAMLAEEGHEATYSMYFHMRPAPFVPQIDSIILREIAATRANGGSPEEPQLGLVHG